ncbi:MAG: DUF167 domain-containing protein [Deltaproteobacteria bacterium]|nr:DUF167 domain-containing protein [Deltaproteobacteria bacterium]
MKIKVKVLPKASCNQVEALGENFFKVKVTAAAVDGKANQALLKLLAKHLGVAKSRLKILQGIKSKDKLLEINF